ncbi:hypothetical protein ACFL1H_04615 [Nanoarchaeota archaeon]
MKILGENKDTKYNEDLARTINEKYSNSVGESIDNKLQTKVGEQLNFKNFPIWDPEINTTFKQHKSPVHPKEKRIDLVEFTAGALYIGGFSYFCIQTFLFQYSNSFSPEALIGSLIIGGLIGNSMFKDISPQK